MAIDTQNVTVTIAHNGTVATVFCILELGEYTQDRAKNEYSCMSSNDSTVSLGSITRSPLEFQLLYNEDTTDGQELLKNAFESNTEFWAQIEFANALAPSNRGTRIVGTFKAGTFTMDFPKDGKIGANFTLEFTSEPMLVAAGDNISVGTPASGSWDCTGSVVNGDGEAGVSINGTDYITSGSLAPGDDAGIISGIVSAIVANEPYWDVVTDGNGLIDITMVIPGEWANGITVVDISTDSGVTATTTDFSGGTYP